MWLRKLGASRRCVVLFLSPLCLLFTLFCMVVISSFGYNVSFGWSFAIVLTSATIFLRHWVEQNEGIESVK